MYTSHKVYLRSLAPVLETELKILCTLKFCMLTGLAQSKFPLTGISVMSVHALCVHSALNHRTLVTRT